MSRLAASLRSPSLPPPPDDEVVAPVTLLGADTDLDPDRGPEVEGDRDRFATRPEADDNVLLLLLVDPFPRLMVE